MKVHYCDIPGCKGEAWHNVDVCVGFKKSEPITIKRDLCDKDYKKWCEVVYETLYKKGGK